MAEPLAVALDASRRFGSGDAAVEALRHATCEVHPGDRIALVGPSGSGKSTLLQLFAGIDTPTTGTVSWPALGARERLRPDKIAVVFQGPSLLPPLSVIENVRLPVLLQGASGDEAMSRGEAALASFGVSHLRDKLPEEISGGQAQRVAIARAIASRPLLLLADEPTGQLDSVTAQEVLSELLDALVEGNVAAIIATHDSRVAERLNEKWQMNHGRLEVGTACST
jgi:ABC-type lipoprotein export system ATPase subunit